MLGDTKTMKSNILQGHASAFRSLDVRRGKRSGSRGNGRSSGSGFSHDSNLSGQFIAVARANKFIFYKYKVPCAQIGHYLSNAVSYARAREVLRLLGFASIVVFLDELLTTIVAGF